jgi:hypothetical protein
MAPEGATKGARIRTPVTVAILGDNSVVDRALEVLLESTGYDVRPIKAPVEGDPGELLRDVRLLLVAPTLDPESRESFLAHTNDAPAAASIPVLTLSTAPGGELFERGDHVHWPCHIEDLSKEIEAALLTASPTETPTP